MSSFHNISTEVSEIMLSKMFYLCCTLSKVLVLTYCDAFGVYVSVQTDFTFDITTPSAEVHL